MRLKQGFWFTKTIVVVLLAHATNGGVVYRVTIEPEGAESVGSGVGRVTLWPPANGHKVAGWRVSNGEGREVAHEVVWQREGEAVNLAFDNSGGGVFYVEALDVAQVAEIDWERPAGLTVETRRLGSDTATADTRAEAVALWENGSAVGCNFIDRIYNGVPPHDVGSFCAVRYQGWLEIEQPGEYAIATASGDASFIAINGEPLAEWPGRHGPGAGVRGAKHGVVTLAKGRHKIDYLNILFDSGFSVVCAWRKPGESAFTVIPASNFSRVDNYKMSAVTVPSGRAPLIYWGRLGYVADKNATLYHLSFRVPDVDEKEEVRWSFDDGVCDVSGGRVEHCFVKGGVRRVRCEMRRDGKLVRQMEQQVRLLRQPVQREINPLPKLRELLSLAAKPTAVRQRNISEIYLLYKIADGAGHPSLAAFAGALLERRGECSGELAAGLYDTGFYYQRPGVRDVVKVERAWQALLEDKTAPVVLRARTKLHLAGFFIHTGRNIERGLQLLATIVSNENLDDGELRLAKIFQGDGALATGDRTGALAHYGAAGLTVDDDDTHYEVRRRVRLETARHYLERDELAAAERLLREIEWERPLERLNLETGMLMMELQRRRGEFDVAMATARRLLAGAPADPDRPELLLALVELYMAQDAHGEAATLYRQLQREYPYSEAAALAKDRYETNQRE